MKRANQGPGKIFRLARVLAYVLAAHAAVFAGAAVVAGVRGSERLEYLVFGAGAVAGVLLALYLLTRLPTSESALVLAVLAISGAELAVLAFHPAAEISEVSGLALWLAAAVDGLGEWSEPLVAFVFLRAPWGVAGLVFVALLFFTARFPRPLTPTDLWIRHGRHGEAGPLRTAWTRFRASLLGPWTLLFAAGAYVYGMRAVYQFVPAPWWFQNLIEVAFFVFAVSYFFDQMAVAGPEDRSRLAWVASGFLATGVLVSVWSVYEAVPELLALLGPQIQPPELLDLVFRWLFVLGFGLGFGLLAVAILGRGALDPSVAIRRTVVYSALGVILTISFAVAEEFLTEWTVTATGVPDEAGVVLAAGAVVLLAPPLRRILDRLFDTGVAVRVGRRLRETERRATVLLSAEYAAYQRLVDADPDRAVQMVTTLRREAQALPGRLARGIGDQVLVEFARPDEAVTAALTLRRAIADAQGGVEEPLELRSALHLGEVLSGPDGDVLGPGPDRVEALRRCSAPGEILLSDDLAGHQALREGLTVRDRAGVEGPAGPASTLVAYEPPGTLRERPRRSIPWLVPSGALAAAVLLIALGFTATVDPLPADPELLAVEGDSLYEAGGELRASDVRRLRARLHEDPMDVTAHGLLFQYHRSRYFDLPYPRNRLSAWRSWKHGEWLVRHRPGEPVAALTSFLAFRGALGDRLASVWLEQAREHGTDSMALYAAASFLYLTSDSTGLELFRQGEARFPGDARFPLRLAAHSLRELRNTPAPALRDSIAGVAIARLGRVLELEPDPDIERAALLNWIRLRARTDRLPEARERAERLLTLSADSTAALHRHVAHTALGLISLTESDRRAAERHLRMSADVRGSLFAPEMALASALLRSGATESVLAYLERCTELASWTVMQRRIRRWIRDVRSGRRPDFGVDEEL